MHFQRITTPDEKVTAMFINYCVRSKPYDFCHMPSRLLTLAKIKEYQDCLFNTCEVYLGLSDSIVKLFVAVSKQREILDIEFIFGNPFEVVKYFADFRFFYKRLRPEIVTFRAYVERKHNVEKLLKFIQSKDPNASIVLDKQEISVLWNT